ncbi:hypothetical protein HF086_006337 [Spodoptera exigua]|uniref:Uncharacterized protein n=1 Tax=Spodoptera exigua TaxID=7107 RepID=A0A922SJZ1_SPOEX|nr:hypothetical protein HF086_006337 [Spodoptera exigua]
MAAIGIDLGSTYSCVAVWCGQSEMIEVIKIEEKTYSMPAYVAFTPKGRLFGVEARDYSVFDPVNTVFSVQRLLGRRYDDLQVQMDMHLWPFSVTSRDGWPVITVDDMGKRVTYTPQQITAITILHLKELAEKHIKTPVTKVVIGVPPFFSEIQRDAMREAIAIAGLQVLRITNNCTASAIACKLYNAEINNVVIYDLGGSTVNVSLLAINGSVYEMNDNMFTLRLGGKDFDSRILAYFAEDFHNKFNVSILNSPSAKRRLRLASEEAKWAFADPAIQETSINIPSLCEGHDYTHILTRDIFEALCLDLYKDTLKLLDKLLEENDMAKTDVKMILAVGGGSKITAVRQVLSEYFESRLAISTCTNPDETAAVGAAIQAAILNGITHSSIKHSVYPDRLPMSLGIEVSRGIMLKMINRHKIIPCTANKEIPTTEDFTTEQTIKVYEGERLVTEDNHFLVNLVVGDFTPDLRGVDNILVGFDVDYHGILRVFARRAPLGQLAEEIVSPETRMNAGQITEMLQNLELVHNVDIVNKDRLDTRYKLESFIFDVKRQIMQRPELLNETESQSMSEELDRAIQWFNLSMDCPKEEFERKLDNLTYRWREITVKIFDKPWTYKPIA